MGFVACKKEALSKIKKKKRGIMEEEEEKGEKKRDGMPHSASCSALCKNLIISPES
jgi:hypothetical protein